MNIAPLGDEDAQGLRERILASPAGRRAHRLHAVLLVAQGLSRRRAAALLGASPRAVSYWVDRYRRNNKAGLSEKRRPGRRSRLAPSARAAVAAALTAAPPALDAPRGRWTGEALRAHVARVHGVSLGLRQCQRVLRASARESVAK